MTMAFRFKQRFKRAFTLVEMIVAMVLGTLLLVALTGVMRRCFSEIANTSKADPGNSRSGAMIEQFRRDLTNARQIAQGPNHFELTGFIHRDPLTLTGTMRAARVRYEIRRVGQQSMLVRVQTEDHQGLYSAKNPLIETVHIGAQNMVLATNEVRPIPQLDQLGSTVASRAGIFANSNSIPSSVQILITDSRGSMVLDHTFMRLRDVP